MTWQNTSRCCLGFCLLALLTPASLSAAESSAGLPRKQLVDLGGFLFVDGQSVCPPYIIQRQGTTLLINEYQLDTHALDLSEYERAAGEQTIHLVSTQQLSSTSPVQMLQFDLLSALKMGDVAMLASGRAPAFLDGAVEGADFLEILLSDDIQSRRQATLPQDGASESAVEAMKELRADFFATPEFIDRATRHLNKLKGIERKHNFVVTASVWGSRLAYPITIFAMVIVVMAFGHLMSNKPSIEMSDHGGESMQTARRVVMRSLLIVALLSVVDLILTILASQTGSMRELNPVGRQWIDNPAQLVIFKVTVVSIAIGLLYRLQERPIAQAASWWSCLVLTLVTARWLTFNSMFL